MYCVWRHVAVGLVLCVGIWSVQRDWMVVTVCCGLSVVCWNMECAEGQDGSDSLLWA